MSSQTNQHADDCRSRIGTAFPDRIEWHACNCTPTNPAPESAGGERCADCGKRRENYRHYDHPSGHDCLAGCEPGRHHEFSPRRGPSRCAENESAVVARPCNRLLPCPDHSTPAAPQPETLCDRSDCDRSAFPQEAYCCVSCENGIGHDSGCPQPETEGVTEAQKYEAFGRAVREWACDTDTDFWSMEISEDLMPLAQKCGLADRVIYDPSMGAIDFAEPGDEIWLWTAAKKVGR